MQNLGRWTFINGPEKPRRGLEVPSDDDWASKSLYDITLSPKLEAEYNIACNVLLSLEHQLKQIKYGKLVLPEEWKVVLWLVYRLTAD